MSFSAIQDFYQKFAQSAELRSQIQRIESLPQLLELLQTWNIHLTGEQLQTLAKTAFDTWILTLEPPIQDFFLRVRQDQSLNVAIENCRHPQDVVILANAYGYTLTEIDIQEAAEMAARIEGFSFEKLWFKRLGLI